MKEIKDLAKTRKRYSIIYADPAWPFNDRQTGGSHKSGSAQKYLTMTIQDIKDLPVDLITKPDAICFIWIPDSLLPQGLEVFTAWGFKFKKKAFTWIKKTKKGKDFYGMGRTTRNGSEDLYMGIKGHPEIIDHSIRQVQYAVVEGHSRKPDLFRNLILQLCGKQPRLELFARQSCCGFDVWGKEVGLGK